MFISVLLLFICIFLHTITINFKDFIVMVFINGLIKITLNWKPYQNFIKLQTISVTGFD